MRRAWLPQEELSPHPFLPRHPIHSHIEPLHRGVLPVPHPNPIGHGRRAGVFGKDKSGEGVWRTYQHGRGMSCGYIMVMTTLTQLLQEAAPLPEDQRLTLVHRLLVAGEPPPSDEVEQAWDVEIRERIARYDRGETRSRPVGEVFSDLDRRLQS